MPEIAYQTNQSLLKQKWQEFVKWRNEIEKTVNRYTAQNMKEMDALIADGMKAGVLTEAENFLEFLEVRYCLSGAKAKMHQIDSILKQFREYLNQVAITNKTRSK